eukprot:SAG11_NODE_5976_length_1421_cov_2.314675_1_plen_70_part_10
MAETLVGVDVECEVCGELVDGSETLLRHIGERHRLQQWLRTLHLTERDASSSEDRTADAWMEPLVDRSCA